jgi:hypothetical protein
MIALIIKTLYEVLIVVAFLYCAAVWVVSLLT